MFSSKPNFKKCVLFFVCVLNLFFCSQRPRPKCQTPQIQHCMRQKLRPAVPWKRRSAGSIEVTEQEGSHSWSKLHRAQGGWMWIRAWQHAWHRIFLEMNIRTKMSKSKPVKNRAQNKSWVLIFLDVANTMRQKCFLHVGVGSMGKFVLWTDNTHQMKSQEVNLRQLDLKILCLCFDPLSSPYCLIA